MKFICEHCGSKYTIADEKVRSKILKIRCKNCNNIIEVRDPVMAKIPESPTPKSESKPPHSVLENKFAASFRQEKSQKKQGTPGLYAAVQRSAQVIEQNVSDRIHWFVAIENAPIGPISARKVHDHREAGRIQDSSLVWKEGMVDWTPMRNCKELVGLLALIDIEISESKAKGAQPKPSPKLGLFEEKPSAKQPLKGKSLGNVDDRIDRPTDEKKEPKEFEIPQAPPKSPADDILDSDFGMNIEGGVGALHTLVPPKAVGASQDRVVKIAAVGFFVVAVATLGVAVFGGDDRVETKTVAGKAVEKVIEKVVFVDRPVAASPEVAGADGISDGDENDESGAAKNRRVVKAKAKPKGTDDKKTVTDERTKELLERMGMSAPVGNANLASRTSRQSSRNGNGAGALTSNQVKSVVNRNKRGAQSCYERALKQGEAPDDKDLRVDFNLTVGSSGMVKSVLVRGAGTRYPTLTQCLKRSVGKWVFPPSSSDSPVEFPIVFTPR